MRVETRKERGDEESQERRRRENEKRTAQAREKRENGLRRDLSVCQECTVGGG